MEVQDEAQWFFAREMEAVNAHTRRYIKKQFFEWHVVCELEILCKFFWFEDEFFLEEIGYKAEQHNA